MTVRRVSDLETGPFIFTPENLAWCETQIAHYPPGRQASAVVPILWRAQKQNNNWISRAVMETVGVLLDMNVLRVLEIATFYSMFNLEPVGRYFIQMCGTTPCLLAGSDELKKVLQKRIGAPRYVTPDGLFSWSEVECLGSCCNAPMIQINDDYFEDLTAQSLNQILDDLQEGRSVQRGSQKKRKSSEPLGALTSLVTLYGTDGYTGPDSYNESAVSLKSQEAR